MRRIKDLKLKFFITFAYALIIAVFSYLDVGCVFLRLFGIACPGCGMTRAIFSALNLDFPSAFSHHFMFWSVPILYLYFLFDGSLFKNKIINRLIFSIIAVGFIINWIYHIK